MWVEQGCPKEKLIIGIPTYGRSWTLGSWSDPTIEYNINATALGGGQNGPLTRAKGFLAYHEICNAIINEGWTKVSDPTLKMGPYAYKVTNTRQPTASTLACSAGQPVGQLR